MNESSTDVVYLVHWLASDDNDNHIVKSIDRDDGCFIGVFSSKQNAEAATERARQLPGFKEYPDQFVISKFSLDEEHWTSGIAWV